MVSINLQDIYLMIGTTNIILEIIQEALSSNTLETARGPEFNPKQDKESVVALILRTLNISQRAQSITNTNKSKIVNSLTQLLLIQQMQILLLRRADKAQDFYSGQVCLPGGKTEKNQTPFETVVRQTQEQTGIILGNDQYIGMLDAKFYATAKINNIQLITFALVFFIQENVKIQLDASQISQYRWIKLNQILRPEGFTYHLIDQRLIKYMLQSQENLESYPYFKDLIFPSINVGFVSTLYGLTFYILAYFFITLHRQLKFKMIEIEKNITLALQKQSGAPLQMQEQKIMRDMIKSINKLMKKIINFRNHYAQPLTPVLKNYRQLNLPKQERLMMIVRTYLNGNMKNMSSSL